MSLLERAGSWMLDYAYVVGWQVRHALARSPLEHCPEGPLAPVLLLPGVYETWEILRPVADRVSRLGHPVHVITGLGRNRGRVAEMASLAQRSVDERGLENVAIIAHSKGGLIGKHMMVHDDRGSRIDRMIAINTPFHGSRYARYALARAIRDFSPRDRTIGMLARELEVNARITSIYAEFDPHIPGGSRLDGATNIVLPLAGHFRPIASELLLDAVEDSLRSPRGRQEGPVT